MAEEEHAHGIAEESSGGEQLEETDLDKSKEPGETPRAKVHKSYSNHRTKTSYNRSVTALAETSRKLHQKAQYQEAALQ